MTDLVAFAPGRPVWLGTQKSKMTPDELAESTRFDRYLVAMHKQGWRYQELASRHRIAVRTVWARANQAREIDRKTTSTLEAKSSVERVLREMVATQQLRIAEQEIQIAELAMQTRRLQRAEKAVAVLQSDKRQLQTQVDSLLSATPTELKVAS